MNLYSYITLATPTTTTICSKPCILSSITVNKAAVNGVITVYDGNTVIAIITSPAAILNDSFTLNYEIYLKSGLKIVTATAAQNITVAYRPSA